MKFHFDRIAFAVLLLGYAVFTMTLVNAPLQDMPNHLTRVHIIADLLFNDGVIYGRDFSFQLFYGPYLSVDLILAFIDHHFGSVWAERLWMTTAVLVIPLGVRSVLSALQVPPRAALTGAALSLYVATGWGFLMGFLNYEIALGCALFTYAWFVRAETSNDRRAWLGYLALVLLSYTMHLSALVFVCAFAGTTAFCSVLQGRTSLRRAAALLAPPYALLALHYLIGSSHVSTNGVTSWGNLADKFVFLIRSEIRFGDRIDLVLFAGFLCAALLPLLGVRSLQPVKRSLSLWLCAAAFIGLYFVLPSVADGIYFIDIRAFPYALIFLLFAGLTTERRLSVLQRVQFPAACVVAAANLAYIVVVMGPEDSALGRYREVANAAAPGAHVLPVNTLRPTGRYDPMIHAGSYATLDARALTPYLFAADRNSHMAYFALRDRDDAPGETWYQEAMPAANGSAQQSAPLSSAPDWKKVEQRYQYLLVTVPWDPLLIPSSYTVAFRNEVAALLKIPESGEHAAKDKPLSLSASSFATTLRVSPATSSALRRPTP